MGSNPWKYACFAHMWTISLSVFNVNMQYFVDLSTVSSASTESSLSQSLVRAASSVMSSIMALVFTQRSHFNMIGLCQQWH